MATRCYPAVKAIPARVDGYAGGTWDHGPGPNTYRPTAFRVRLSTSKSDAGAQTARSLSCDRAAPYDLSFGYAYMTEPSDVTREVGGTFDVCFHVQCRWINDVTINNDAKARYKVHVYITQGLTAKVRHILLDNYVDTVDFPGISGGVWRSLVAPQPLVAGQMLAGDCLIVEIGARITVTDNVVTPTYPPDEWTRLDWRATGANAAFDDAIAGETNVSRAPWLEFSDELTFAALPAPPDNDACADALAFTLPTDAPYVSPDLDTTQSADAARGVWFAVTPPQAGEVFIHTLGSTYDCDIDVFKNGCGTLTPANYGTRTGMVGNRGTSLCVLDALVEPYLIRVRSNATTACATNSGGLLRLTVTYRGVAAEDDVLIPSDGMVSLFHQGVLVNCNPAVGQTAIGLAVDYSGDPMTNHGGSAGGDPHTRERVLIALFNGSNAAEVLDLPTLSYTRTGATDIDLIQDPWDEQVPYPSSVDAGITSLHLNRTTGKVTALWHGNGFLYVAGEGQNRPAFLDSPPSIAALIHAKTHDATLGDNDAGAPYTAQYDALELPAGAITALQGDIDPVTNVLYYTPTSVEWSVDNGVALQTTIKRFNLTTRAQLPDFCTFVPLGGGASGLCLLGDGGILLCNGPVVQRYNNAGTLVGTFTSTHPDPNVADGNKQCTDVRITADGLHAIALDVWTMVLYKFDLATMSQVAAWETFLQSARTYQFALYQPNTLTPPIPPPSLCVLELPSTQCWGDDELSAQCTDTPTTPDAAAWGEDQAPATQSLESQPTVPPAGACWFGPFSVDVLRTGLNED